MSQDPSPDSPPVNLFDKIGGAPAVARLVESFYARVMADPALKPFFEHASVENLIAMQREFFTAALGGPGEYRGKSLAHAHHGRGIKRKHFQAFVEHLLETLRQFDLSDEERYGIISRISTYVDEITGGVNVDG